MSEEELIDSLLKEIFKKVYSSGKILLIYAESYAPELEFVIYYINERNIITSFPVVFNKFSEIYNYDKWLEIFNSFPIFENYLNTKVLYRIECNTNDSYQFPRIDTEEIIEIFYKHNNKLLVFQRFYDSEYLYDIINIIEDRLKINNKKQNLDFIKDET